MMVKIAKILAVRTNALEEVTPFVPLHSSGYGTVKNKETGQVFDYYMFYGILKVFEVSSNV